MAKQFIEGNQYLMKSICDSNCIWSYTVVKRTAKTVTLSDGQEITKCRIKVIDDQETCKPLGTYSMSPTLKA